MTYLLSDLDIEDMVYVKITYPKGCTLSSEDFSGAVALLDDIVDNEEDGETGEMLAGLQILKLHLHEATGGAAKLTILNL